MTYRVLLVEDDAQIREIIEDCFAAKGGMEIVSAQDGHEGAMLATTGAPLISSTFTFSVLSAISLAFCGQTTKHCPQRIHSSLMICA